MSHPRHTLTRYSAALASLRGPLAELGRSLVDLYAPPECASCGDPRPSFPRASPSLCALCARALEPASDPPLPGAVAPYEHGGPLAHAIRRAKYDDAPATARALGRLLAHTLATLRPALLASHTLVVPVPLHATRLRARGYNQALELARGLASAHGAGHLVCVARALVRVRDTQTQVHRGGDERRANLAGAFAPGPHGLRAIGARVLLLDDVLTTGATLGDAARALYEAGAGHVTPVALAQASLRHHP